ncbi:MAG: hypothetical protein JEY99_07010 [Spirochaetales bacterium]|nr:hypothetical protein [Spirochaetales bacterium]
MNYRYYRIRSIIFISCILLLLSTSVWAAGILVPRMELYSHGSLEDDTLKLRTRGNIQMDLEGGYKLGGKIAFKMDSTDFLENDALDADEHNLEFKYGSVTINGLLNIPLDLTYFVGEGDILCEGKSFNHLFGTWNFATNYSGYLYFPEGTLYEGISKVDGTGLSLTSDFGRENIKAFLYTYQDNTLDLGEYTTTGRILFNLESLKLEAFLKASYPVTEAGLYGAGLLFYFKPAETGEFFAQIGIPRWDPVDDDFGIDLFYFLFEPRLNLGPVSVVMTYFLRPGYYLNQATDEAGNMDLNLNFMLGQPEVTPISGGVETTLQMASGDENFFNLSVSPYFGAITSGVVWDCKVKINIVRDDSSPMFEGFIGVKAEF